MGASQTKHKYLHYFTFPGLRSIIEPALESVTLDNIRKYFHKACEYERVYRDGYKAGADRDGYKAGADMDGCKAGADRNRIAKGWSRQGWLQDWSR